MEHYQKTIDDDLGQNLYEELPYVDIPEYDTDAYEPKRSRVQIDISKATRLQLRQLARDNNRSVKALIAEALAARFPELTDALDQEVKRQKFELKHSYTEDLDDKPTT